MDQQNFSTQLTTARILFSLSLVNILNRSQIDDDSFTALLTLLFSMDDFLRDLADQFSQEF